MTNANPEHEQSKPGCAEVKSRMHHPVEDYMDVADLTPLTPQSEHWNYLDPKKHEALLSEFLSPLIGEDAAKIIAERLIQRFRSSQAAVAADPHSLLEVPGVSYIVAHHFGVAKQLAQRIAKGEIQRNRPILKEWPTLIEYLRSVCGYAEIEHFRIVYLDRQGRFLHDELVRTGTYDHVSVYPTEVIRRCLQRGATYLIMVHNHPSGNPAPSASDLQMVNLVDEAGLKLGIRVFDAIIVTGSTYKSFRKLGLLGEF